MPGSPESTPSQDAYSIGMGARQQVKPLVDYAQDQEKRLLATAHDSATADKYRDQSKRFLAQKSVELSSKGLAAAMQGDNDAAAHYLTQAGALFPSNDFPVYQSKNGQLTMQMFQEDGVPVGRERVVSASQLPALLTSIYQPGSALDAINEKQFTTVGRSDSGGRDGEGGARGLGGALTELLKQTGEFNERVTKVEEKWVQEQERFDLYVGGTLVGSRLPTTVMKPGEDGKPVPTIQYVFTEAPGLGNLAKQISGNNQALADSLYQQMQAVLSEATRSAAANPPSFPFVGVGPVQAAMAGTPAASTSAPAGPDPGVQVTLGPVSQKPPMSIDTTVPGSSPTGTGQSATTPIVPPKAKIKDVPIKETAKQYRPQGRASPHIPAAVKEAVNYAHGIVDAQQQGRGGHSNLFLSKYPQYVGQYLNVVENALVDPALPESERETLQRALVVLKTYGSATR